MSQTQSTTPESRVEELTAQVEALRTRRGELNQELTEAAQTHFQVAEQAKIGLAPVADVEAPRAAKENLKQLLSEVENELAQAQLDLDAENAAQAEAAFWAELRDLAAQAEVKGAAFDAIRNRVTNELVLGLHDMDASKREWAAVRQNFRDKAMRRISALPAISGKVGRFQSDTEHSKDLLTQLQNQGSDVRNVRDALPHEATFGLVPRDYPCGPLDSEPAAFSPSVQRMFDERDFRKYL